MLIRKAGPGDVGALCALLSQVLEIHAAIRPDIFVPGTTKYSPDELCAIVADDASPVYAAEEDGAVIGYAFCRIREPQDRAYLVPARTLFIDDLCVDAAHRGHGVGEALFTFVREEARRLGCRDVMLAVWEGNDAARRFYEKMGMKPRETMMEIGADPCKR